MCKWILLLFCIVLFPATSYSAPEDQLLSNARAMVTAGDRLGAAQLVESAVGTRTDQAAAWLRGYALVWRNQKRDALVQFQSMAAAFPGSAHRPNALLMIGYLHDGFSEDAKSDWEAVVREYPQTKEAAESLHCLGHLALRAGNQLDAVQKFEQSAAVAEADPAVVADSLTEAGYACISRYWQSRDFDALASGIPRLKRLIAQAADPRISDKARMGLGEIYLIQGFHDRALAEYRQVAESGSADRHTQAMARFEIACCLFGQKDYAGAIAVFDAFVADCNGSTLKEKDAAWKAARPGYADLIARDPQKASKICGLDLVPEALSRKSLALFKLRRYEDAQKLALQVIGEFPSLECTNRAKEVKDLCTALSGR